MATQERANKNKRALLSKQNYLTAFDNALMLVTNLKPAGRSKYQRNDSQHDGRLSNDQAADADFYPSLEFRQDRMVYTLTKSFFELSLAGFAPTAKPLQDESLRAFRVDCATNYLVKNFWHNIVHVQMQQITGSNYRDFRGESRYSSDFDADCLATVMLALTYGHAIHTDRSSQTDPENDNLRRLFLRNRCNRAFALREQARLRDRNAPSDNTIDGLLEKEWLIRRLLVNELCMRCLERGRALPSISVNFFGPIQRKNGRYERPNAGAAVEMNGVYFSLGTLGNFAHSKREEVKNAVERYATSLDNQYAGALRRSSTLSKFARMNLKARVHRLISRRLVDRATGMRIANLKIGGGSAAAHK